MNSKNTSPYQKIIDGHPYDNLEISFAISIILSELTFYRQRSDLQKYSNRFNEVSVFSKTQKWYTETDELIELEGRYLINNLNLIDEMKQENNLETTYSHDFKHVIVKYKGRILPVDFSRILGSTRGISDYLPHKQVRPYELEF